MNAGHTPIDSDCVIVYCTEKAQAEKLAQVLKDDFDLAADFFHGGMSDCEKKAKMNKFKENQIEVMCSTTAFGMGIDKRNVRAVIHFTMSYSLTNYYQESSRAGRDGKPSYCVVYHHVHDVRIVRNVLTRNKTGAQLTVARARFGTMAAYCHEAKRCRHLMIQQCVLHVPVGAESLFEHMKGGDTVGSESQAATCCDNCRSRHRNTDVTLSLPMSDIKECFREVIGSARPVFAAVRAAECVERLLKQHWRRVFPASNGKRINDYTTQQVLTALMDKEIVVRSRGTKALKFSRGYYY